jgi:hypothetical protein
MPLGSPDAAKLMLVSKLRRLNQQLVFITVEILVCAEKEHKSEFHSYSSYGPKGRVYCLIKLRESFCVGSKLLLKIVVEGADQLSVFFYRQH